MRDSDPITRLTAARFDGPQALYTEAVRLLSERPALPGDLAGLVARLRGITATSFPAELGAITDDAADAIEALAAENMKFADVRTWFHYPIVMPLKDGSGPASDAECDTITWEVWDELLNSHASFDNLPDAINEAMRLNNAITEGRKLCERAIRALPVEEERK